MNLWLIQSLSAMLLLVPAWLAVNFFLKNFRVSSDVFLMWYMAGVILGTIAIGKLSQGERFLAPIEIIGAIVLVGCTIGAGANLLLYRAITNAPNQGLPIAIANAASILVFLSSFILAKLLPKWFSAETSRFDPLHFVGMLLIFAGIALITVRK